MADSVKIWQFFSSFVSVLAYAAGHFDRSTGSKNRIPAFELKFKLLIQSTKFEDELIHTIAWQSSPDKIIIENILAFTGQ